MWNAVLDLFFPRFSLTGREGEWVTTDEYRQLVSLRPVVLQDHFLRLVGIESLEHVVACSSYHASPLLKLAIHRYKYKRIPALGETLGSMLISASRLLPIDDAVVCPVPLRWTRRFQRGFNQAEPLADAVGRGRGWPVERLLRRSRATGHQAWRGKAERRTAMKNAFVCIAEKIPERVVLIDDVSTTGATLEECARVLKNAGARWIGGLVLAHG